MGSYQRDDVSIHYDEYGEGFPILLIAPGGMRSAATFWEGTPWNPIEQLRDRFRVIAMDQRNAGRSTGPIAASDGWHTYAADQLALMDHLGYERFHVAGMCIGGPYAMGLIEAAPRRVSSAVLFQPIGLDDNRRAFYEMFDGWADALRAGRPEISGEAWAGFRSNLYDGDFLFNVGRDFVAGVETPLLVLLGDDLYHPSSISREIVALARDCALIEDWKEGSGRDAAMARVAEFLVAHTP